MMPDHVPELVILLFCPHMAAGATHRNASAKIRECFATILFLGLEWILNPESLG
jgi:hypothetical protein